MVCAIAPRPVAAELIAYEPFDYAAGTPLPGANDGMGFASAWAAGGFNAKLFNLFQVSPGVLEYPGLAMKGTTHVQADAAGQGIAGLGRALSKPLGTESGTYFLSFLHRPEGDAEYGSIVLGTGQGNELAIGKSSSTGEYYISNRGGVGRILSGVPGEVGKTRLIVVKMEFLPGPDRFTLHVDPVPGRPEPATGLVKEDLDLEFADKIFLYSRAAWSVDEIRLGTTWEDVTPAGGAMAGSPTVAASWKLFLWVGAILLAFVVIIVPLVIVWIVAYRRGQKKARSIGN
ncbi:MAG TPA: hypothetical protein VGF13_13155 [Verrucomicrobiae bacterium]|jgi:hypothetical protein